jgi:DNA-binding NarL/FixJ family response regulator
MQQASYLVQNCVSRNGVEGWMPGAILQPAAAVIGAARADRRARILVVEDHEFVRAGIVGLLNGQPDFFCCGECDTVGGARLAVAQCKPDLILLDLNLKDGHALELIGGLRLEFPECNILVLSQLDEAIYAPKVLQSGARGYLMKEAASEKLFEALRAVLSGGTYLSQEMTGKMAPGTASGKGAEWAAGFAPRRVE